MVDVKEVAHKVYRLEAPVPGVNTIFAVYLIQESEGVLIEPGPTAAIPSIQEGMKQLGMEDLTYIIPTHIHIDHAGGIGTLAQLFPGAKVVVHPRGVKHAADPSRLIESTRTVFGADFEALFGPIVPVPESQLKVPEDGEIISINGRELQIIYAPGHAPHHMVIFDHSVNGLFCGEALGLPGSSNIIFPLPAVAPPSFDQELYLETIERLRQLGAQMLFYSHGGVELETDVLISMAAENTRTFGDIILKALKEGETLEAISRRIGDHVASHYGLEVNEMDLALIIAGYSFYFKKKGLA
ncbi:MAG: MBL fold metallo-hydrolase [Dehalococcoidia bacterium]|nr:MBL fold metallo-hydrolase [Dehalococcoidia bacterium]